MPDAFPYDVFLSHSAKDKAVVRPLAERLRKDGVKLWFDEWVLKPGDSISAKIQEGLERSRVLVLCMSAQAFGSDWAQLEFGTFRFRDPLIKERRFIPLRLDDAPIKGSLAQFLYINWRPADHEREYPKLLQACQIVGTSAETGDQTRSGWCIPTSKDITVDRDTRDDFSKQTKDTLAKRVGMRCSNPACGKPTSGPHTDSNAAINIGVAAHITAASAGGPRFDESLSAKARCSIQNAIWLCQNCAKLVDNDKIRYTVEFLLGWKSSAEENARGDVESPAQAQPSRYKTEWSLRETSGTTEPPGLLRFYAHAPAGSLNSRVTCLLTNANQSAVCWHNIYRGDKNRLIEMKPWFHDPANLVPLHRDIAAAMMGKKCDRLGALKSALTGKDESLEEFVRFENLRSTAAKHAKEWRFGCAIGCYRLASCLYPPSWDKDQRLQISCEPIRHLRHHVHYRILENTLHDVSRLLDEEGFVQGETLLLLEYDLLALLDEHGLQFRGMRIAKELHERNLIKRHGKNLPSEKLGTIDRRVYSINLRDHHWVAAGAKLRDKLNEQAMNILPLRASLATTQVVKALLMFTKSGQKSAAKDLGVAFEKVCSQCDEFQEAFSAGEKPRAGPSDVAEMFYYRGILAHLIEPQRWRNIEANSCDSAERRFNECRALLTNPSGDLWDEVLHRAKVDPLSEAPIACLTRNLRRKSLPGDIEDIVFGILEKTHNTLVSL